MDRPPPSTTAMLVATAILAGVAGFFLGQGASIGVFASTPRRRRWGMTVKAPAGHGSSDDELEGEDSEEEDRGELATFEGNTDEVKLVLVVRTDLGMGKGMDYTCLFCLSFYCHFSQAGKLFCAYALSVRTDRQDRSSMLPCNSRLLQALLLQITLLSNPQALGTRRTSQGRATGEKRGGYAHATGPGDKLRPMCACHPGCWPHTDRKWESDRPWSFGTQERC